MISSRERAAIARKVVSLEQYRAKYVTATLDPFLRDAATSARLLRIALRAPECAPEDLRVLHARLCHSLALYDGLDPLAARLRQEAVALGAAIAGR